MLKDYRFYTEIKKDDIVKCKDCEFRYICTDCRAYLENSNDIYSAPNQMLSTDRANQDSLRIFIKKIGWPQKSQWPKNVCLTAWLIVQHADNDIQFQKECLTQMKILLNTNNLDVKNYPYLVNRILINNCERQLYGTQFWLMFNDKGIPESIEFKPIKESSLVNKRRKYFNLILLKYYRSQALKRYKRKYE